MLLVTWTRISGDGLSGIFDGIFDGDDDECDDRDDDDGLLEQVLDNSGLRNSAVTFCGVVGAALLAGVALL